VRDTIVIYAKTNSSGRKGDYLAYFLTGDNS